MPESEPGEPRKPPVRWQNGIRIGTTAKIALMQTGAATLGLAWGFLLPFPFNVLYTPAALLGMVAVGQWVVRDRVEDRIRLVCGLVLVYQLALVLSEPFQHQDPDGQQAAFGLCLLAVLLAASGVMARLGVWSAAIGAAVFFAASIAMILRNGVSVTYTSGGSGFFSGGNVR